MGETMSDLVALISRLLMSSIFIVYGYLKFADVTTITNLGGTKRFMDMIASGTAAPAWLGYLIAALELGGGLAILLGLKTRWVAGALVGYVVVATLLGHPFWVMEGAARAGNEAHFFKNLAIIAAYLLIAMTGAGRYSLDQRLGTQASKR
jgi:putative oxidoreductase